MANKTVLEQEPIGFQLNNNSLISCNFNKQICDSTYFTRFLITITETVILLTEGEMQQF